MTPPGLCGADNLRLALVMHEHTTVSTSARATLPHLTTNAWPDARPTGVIELRLGSECLTHASTISHADFHMWTRARLAGRALAISGPLMTHICEFTKNIAVGLGRRGN